MVSILVALMVDKKVAMWVYWTVDWRAVPMVDKRVEMSVELMAAYLAV